MFCSLDIPAASLELFLDSGTVAFAFGVAAFIASAITGNDSWVDRSWSIVPVFFAWYYAVKRGDSIVTTTPGGTPWLTALGAFASVITVWGVRLSYNFYRRGGYEKGGEDYRWEHVRGWPIWKHRWLWYLFSFGFISVFQEWLLWAITVPLLAVPANVPACGLLLVVAVTMLGFIVVETVADQQQWNFQHEKRNLRPRRPELEGDYARGFLTHGLFSISRHPNVWAEQSIWLTLYAASVLARPTWGILNIAGLGALTLVLLTISSCAMTEKLSTAKYPSYTVYGKLVPVLLPAPWTRRERIDARLNNVISKTD